jgi:hypothetical protein
LVKYIYIELIGNIPELKIKELEEHIYNTFEFPVKTVGGKIQVEGDVE